MSETFTLESCRELFADNDSMAKFATKLHEATRGFDNLVVMFQDEHIVTVLSQVTFQLILRDQILRRLTEQPILLKEVR